VNPDIYMETVRYLALAEAAMAEGDNEAAQIYASMANVTAQLGAGGRMRPPHAGGPPPMADLKREMLARRGVIPNGEGPPMGVTPSPPAPKGPPETGGE
jgi:hypothetical protein